MKKRLIAAIILTVIIGTGCSKGEQQEEITKPGVEEAQEEENIEPWTKEDEQELYNLYVQINNVMLGRMGDSIGKYFEYVEYQEEFSVLDDSYFCYSISNSFFENLERADELLERKEEHTELDKTYLSLSPVAKELGETLNEVYAYTDEDAFLEDDFAKGKELHAKLFASCAKYETLGTEFIEKVRVASDEKREENLAQMKEEGYEVTYALVQMLSTAQEIQNAILEQGIEDDSKLLELDTEAIKPLCDRYREEVTTALSCLEDEEALAKEGFPTSEAYYLTLQRAAENSLEELDKIFQSVSEQKEPNSYGMTNAFMVDGTLAGFYSKVSAMIDEYNRIIG